MILKYFDNERLIHGIKTAFACVLGLIVTHLIQLHSNPWLVITIIVVMCAQINVGSVLNKSSMRFLGTLSGSILATLTLLAFGANHLAIIIVIAISSMLFSYIATGENSYKEAGTLGAVTVAIILLGLNPTTNVASERFVEISLGILIATLVSQFVLPISARDHLRAMQAKTLEQLGEYYQITFVANPHETVIQELDEAVVKSLTQQRTLSKQASREPFGDAFDPVYFSNLLRCEKEIFRSIVFMHYAGNMLPPGKNIFIKLPEIQKFHQTICETFTNLALSINKKNFYQTTSTIPSLQPMKEAIHAIRPNAPLDELVYLDGYLFCAEILIVQLTEVILLLKTKFPAAS